MKIAGVNLAVLVFALVTEGCGEASQPERRQATVRSTDRVIPGPAESRCRDRIPTLMCLTRMKEGTDGWPERETGCAQNSSEYAWVFERLYDMYPRPLQNVFCRLATIDIAEGFSATATAGRIDPNNSWTAAMVIRRDFVDNFWALEEWASWKEQLPFGGNAKSLSYDPTLPTVRVAAPAGVDMLYFVVAHEFGHILDTVNDFEVADESDRAWLDAKAVPGSWSALSWSNRRAARPEYEFAHRRAACFYGMSLDESCMPLSRDAVTALYHGLEQSNFISLYASSSPMEDFADSLAHYLLAQHLGATYVVDTGQGSFYDVTAKLHSAEFAEKYAFIEAFLQADTAEHP